MPTDRGFGFPTVTAAGDHRMATTNACRLRSRHVNRGATRKAARCAWDECWRKGQGSGGGLRLLAASYLGSVCNAPTESRVVIPQADPSTGRSHSWQTCCRQCCNQSALPHPPQGVHLNDRDEAFLEQVARQRNRLLVGWPAGSGQQEPSSCRVSFASDSNRALDPCL